LEINIYCDISFLSQIYELETAVMTAAIGTSGTTVLKISAADNTDWEGPQRNQSTSSPDEAEVS
jgi:hypothetical protein